MIRLKAGYRKIVVMNDDPNWMDGLNYAFIAALAGFFLSMAMLGCADADTTTVTSPDDQQPFASMNDAGILPEPHKPFVFHDEVVDEGPIVLANDVPFPYAKSNKERLAATVANSATVVPTLILSPASEALRPYLESSARRFSGRLNLNIIVADGGVRVKAWTEVIVHGSPVNAAAHYAGGPCRFQECNAPGRAWIDIELAMFEPEHINHIDQVLDHEIGHVLSSWGSAVHKDQHLPTGHIMQAIFTEMYAGDFKPWTQEDADFWCSASPCGIMSCANY